MALPRQKLKSKFRNGSRPSQSDFDDLIDSDINSEDDGIEFFADGVKLSKPASGNKNDSGYQIQFGDATRNALEFYHQGDNSVPLLSITGNGISTNGIIAQGDVSMRARRGSFTQKNVLAPPPKQPHIVNPVTCNDAWHTILYTAKICQAYEIVAQLKGDTNAMLVAFASTSESTVIDPKTDKKSGFTRMIDAVGNFVQKIFGISNTKIKVIQSYSDWLNDRIKIKWVEEDESYSLQVKAASGHIYYSITQLWDADFISGNN